MDLFKIKVGDFVLCNPVNVFWNHDFAELDLPPESGKWGPTTWGKPDLTVQRRELSDEWFEVVHTLFDKDDSEVNPAFKLTWMGQPLFLYVEIPKTSYLYTFCNHPFDINEKIYGQDPVTVFKMSPAMHGKMVADIWKTAIKDVRYV